MLLYCLVPVFVMNLSNVQPFSIAQDCKLALETVFMMD